MDEINAGMILPPHEVEDEEKLAMLIDSMSKNGWVGNPIAAYNSFCGIQALTGSHRIAAAKELDIDIPVYITEEYHDEYDYLAGEDLLNSCEIEDAYLLDLLIAG